MATLSVSDDLGPSAPDSAFVTATDAQQYVEIQIVEANAVVASLTLAEVTNAGNQAALTTFLSQATVSSQNGDTTHAIFKLQEAMQRTDGCTLRGSPDTIGAERDWITDCGAQRAAYAQLTAALDALSQP